MRRGRLAKLRAGVLLPWTRAPYGYRVSPDRPRDPRGVTTDPAEAAVVAEDVGRVERPALGGVRAHVRREPFELLLNGLVVDPMAGRDAAVDRYTHGMPPAG